MKRRCSFRYPCVFALIATLAPTAAFAQSATYHLHKEASKTAGVFQLKTAAPDAGSAAINLDLKNRPVGVYKIKDFDTAAGVPNLVGVIPSGSTVSMVLWMRKTANVGAIYPRGRLTLNSPTGTALCETTGTTALTTTLAAMSISCNTTTNIAMASTDRVYFSVGVQVSAAPGNTAVKVEFRIEGALNGNHDSRITTPLPGPPPVTPVITGIAPASGPVGAPVSIAGSNFGASQGTSQVLFGAVAATATAWSASAITATVPAGASSGNVTVKVQGLSSNSVPFAVTVTSQEVAGPLNYVYDGLGRLVQMTSVSGETTIYRYDAVGNMLAIERLGTGGGGGGGGSSIAIGSFSPLQGPVGTAVAIAGAGFSSTPTDNIVSFNGTPSSVTAASANQLVAVVPAGATTGPIGVTAPAGTASSESVFTVVTTLGVPTITGLSPAIGVTGTPFTILGANFETTPANDRATLNIRPADVTAATTTTLNTAVPLASMGGRVTVSTPAGSATSDADFVVVPSPYTAADVDSSQRLAPGESRTVTVNTSGHIGLLLFDGTAGQKVSVFSISNTWTGCPAVRPYLITIYAPDASLVKSIGNGCGTETFMDQERLPLTGTYTLMIDPNGSNVGSATVTVYTFADVTGTITANGTPIQVSLTTPGQNGRFTFTGTQGQVVSGLVTNSTIPGSCATFSFSVALIRPDGSTHATMPSCGGSLFLDRQTLPMTGTYTLVLDPVWTFVGNATVALYTIVDVTGPIADGVSVPVTLTTPGQNARFTFNGTPGQVVTGLVSNATIPGSCAVYAFYLALVRPDGSTQATVPSCGGGTFLDRQTLTSAGVYTLVLDAVAASTGNASVTLYNVVDVTGPIEEAVGVPVTLNTPGQNARFTFNGTAGQVITELVWGPTFPGNCGSFAYYLWLLRPDGSAQATIPSCGGGTFLDRQTLSSSGTYTLMLDPVGTGTGAANVAFFAVVDVTGPITPNGPAVPISITKPGQNALLTFSGTAGQVVNAFSSGNTIPGSCAVFGFSLNLVKPDGSTLGSVSSCGGNVTLGQRTLPVTGTYTLFLNPADSRTGSIAITLTSP